MDKAKGKHERIRARRLSLRAVGIFGGLAMTVATMLSADGHEFDESMHSHPARHAEMMTLEQKDWFNKTIEPVAEDAAAHAFAYYKANKNNAYDPHVLMSLGTSTAYPDIAELHIVHHGASADLYREVDIYAEKQANGQPDLHKLRAVRIILGDTNTYQATTIESGEGKFGADTSPGFWQINEKTLFLHQVDPQHPNRQFVAEKSSGQFVQRSNVADNKSTATALTASVMPKLTVALRPF